MNDKKLDIFDIDPTGKTEAIIIWLHGLGADGYDFKDVPQQLAITKDINIRFVFPHAPLRPITINNHMVMRAWYDIFSLERSDYEDEIGLKNSSELLNQLIKKETLEHPTAKIILAGFSQGGATALFTGLSHATPLTGIIALSSYLALRQSVDKWQRGHNTPIFLGHGVHDPIVKYQWGVMSKDILQHWQYPITWRDYSTEHHLCEEEFRDIDTWLRTIFSCPA